MLSVFTRARAEAVDVKGWPVGPSRRDFIREMLGLAVLGACRPRQTWQGQFVDPSMALGHQLRDTAPQQPNGEQQARVVILGGGIAGLTAGWRLLRRGFGDFVLLELEDRPGGTALGETSAVTGYPWAAHYVPCPNASNIELLELLTEVGAVHGYGPKGEPLFAEEHRVAAPKERVFFQGAWHSGLYPRALATESDLLQYQRFYRLVDQLSQARDADGRRAFAVPVAASSDASKWVALDQYSMAQWLEQQGFDSPLLYQYVAYACRDDFGTEPTETSAWYGLHYFAARADAGDAADFLTWPDGNGFLVRHLAEKLGTRVKTGVLATQVRPRDDGRLEVWTQNTKIVAERVIFALPAYLLRILNLPGVVQPSVSYAPWLVANVHLRQRPEYPGAETAWDNVIWGSRSLGYVVANHRDGPATGPSIWTWYLPLTGDPKTERKRLHELSWAEAAQLPLAELSHCHRDFERYVSRIDVRRWGHGMIRPVVGTATDPERKRRASPVGGVHFAHTDLSGVALFEEAFFHGNRAALEVLAALRAP